jgi:photosynthetic reaction center cytochrome c subunit
MKLGSRRAILSALATAVVYLLGVASAGGQAGTEQKPLMAEDAFKNIQLLRGISVSQFMATMGFFSASLNENCTFCHGLESGGSWARYADDTPNKQTARRMILMMTSINQTYFAGRRVVTCYSCHRGGERPKVTPSLAEVYGAPIPEDPDEIEPAPGAPPVGQILDKYVQALGGAQRLASLTSFVAKGTYQGYDDPEKLPLEVFAKAPDQRTTIVHTLGGDSTTVYDGRVGWVAAPDTLTPVPVIPLSGADLDGAKVDAALCFPAQVQKTLSEWRVGFSSTIGDREVQVVQGTSAWGSPVKLYFDKKSGLLARQVRYTNVPVGRVPTQIDYADYRDVSGVKMPFRWSVTWVDGRSTIQLSEVQPNAPVDAAKFAKPAPPAPTRSSAATP